MLGIGIYFSRKTLDLGDYYLGGRRMNKWVVALSAQASDMSGWLLMGLPGAIYLSGLSESWIGLGLAAGDELAQRGELGRHVAISTQRVLIGFGIGAVLGLVLGALVFLQTGKGRDTREFLSESRFELRKVVWPTREEATRTTWVVVIVVIILSLILAAFDFGIQKAIELFLNFGR